MKKLFALFLVVCMVVGLVACGSKPADKNPTTTPTTGTTPTQSANTSFNGKTIQFYGLGTEETYTDYDAFGKGNYLWMMKAAVDEWAHANGVTIKYMGSYNQNQMLAAMASGEKPDIVFQSNNYPAAANYGILGAFTEEEYNELAEICGKGYLDMMVYRTKSHGFVVPWVGNSMCYYNKSMFERYDVKTPKEYFMEGNWTWTTFQQCMEAMTKDLDADGVTDTYGIPADTSWGRYPQREDEKGKLLSFYDEDYQYLYDHVSGRYDQLVNKKTILSPGTNKIQTNVTYPMYAMQISDCEPYNFEHCYQTLANGDELEVVPAPAYDGSATGKNYNIVGFTQSALSLVSSCDEREAAMDLLKHILKCGLKYMSDFSLNAVKCDYAGIQGTSELSKKWKEAFAQVCADRAEAIKEIEFDQALSDKIYAYHATCEWDLYKPYADVTAINKYSEFWKMPPASSFPAIKEKYEANLKKYNDLYIFD